MARNAAIRRTISGWEPAPNADGLFDAQSDEVQRILVWWFNRQCALSASRHPLWVRVGLMQKAIDNAPEYAVWMVKEATAKLEGKTLEQAVKDDGALGLTGDMAKHLGLLGE